MYNAVVHISLSKNVLHITTCSNFVPKCLDSGVYRTTFKSAKTRVSGYWPYQYGVPMKDIRRARVAVIWAEIPKSATQQWKQKNIIITIMPNSNLIKYTLALDNIFIFLCRWFWCAKLTRHVSVHLEWLEWLFVTVLKSRPWI